MSGETHAGNWREREANMCECHWAGSMIWLEVMFRGYAWHFFCVFRADGASHFGIYERSGRGCGEAIYGDCIQVHDFPSASLMRTRSLLDVSLHSNS